MGKGLMILFIGSLFTLVSCSNNEEPFYESTISFEFNDGTHGWNGDFADYPVTDSVFYELQFAHTKLPVPLDTTRRALKISGNNHSDDLFMFIKRKVTGLIPNATYQIVFNMDLASRYPTNAIGVGGAPGESVVIKVGATAIEPDKVAEDGYYYMNIEKDNQSGSGKDMQVIGHVGVSDTTSVFTMINRNNKSTPFTATADNQGSLWLIIGTESGFEATTTLYFKRIEVTFR